MTYSPSGSIRAFQQHLFEDYIETLSLPDTYKYVYGNPVQPVVPLDTATGSVMIIGSHPTAVLACIGEEREVPVRDVSRPFPDEWYFDGLRPRSAPTAAQLEEALLLPLQLQRRQCWLTHLVHVFLFKQEHIEQYRRLGSIWPESATSERFETLARESLLWVAEEIALAAPKLIVTLGASVAGILQDVSGQAARNALLDGSVRELVMGGKRYPVIHVAEPGQVLRQSIPGNPWPEMHQEKHLPALRRAIRVALNSGESTR